MQSDLAGSGPKGALIVAIVLLAAIAIVTRLWGLDWPVALDYDEGVYWQTLRAAAAGSTIYDQIFFSQPPLLANFGVPIFQLFGGTLFAARLVVALPSLIGLAAAFALGAAVAGRSGGVLALLLTVTAPSVLNASRTLQADGPSAVAIVVALAFALWWWHRPRLVLALACGVALALGILVKLMAVVAVAPIVIIGALALWEVHAEPAALRRHAGHLAAGAAAAAGVVVVVLLAHAGTWPEMISQIVTFHVDARAPLGAVDPLRQLGINLGRLAQFVQASPVLCLVAAWGLAMAVATRNKLALPIAGLLAASLLFLLLQVPVFSHHNVILAPPLIALAIFALPTGAARPTTKAIGISLITLCVVFDVAAIGSYFARTISLMHGQDARVQQMMIADLEVGTAPSDWVVSDDQFVVALANRDTPPWLADTSNVRLASGYLSGDELCGSIENPRVTAVLLTTGRLDSSPGFDECVAAGFELSHQYAPTQELWLRRASSRP